MIGRKILTLLRPNIVKTLLTIIFFVIASIIFEDKEYNSKVTILLTIGAPMHFAVFDGDIFNNNILIERVDILRLIVDLLFWYIISCLICTHWIWDNK